jgi:hypothetical protein
MPVHLNDDLAHSLTGRPVIGCLHDELQPMFQVFTVRRSFLHGVWAASGGLSVEDTAVPRVSVGAAQRYSLLSLLWI